jgi:periplasmic mercuric ion binding protein
MKSSLTSFLLMLCLLLTGVALAGEQTQTLVVENMTCVSCPFIVKKALTAVDGVKAVEVSLDDKIAVVTYDDTLTNSATLTAATTNVGFPSRVTD